MPHQFQILDCFWMLRESFASFCADGKLLSTFQWSRSSSLKDGTIKFALTVCAAAAEQGPASVSLFILVRLDTRLPLRWLINHSSSASGEWQCMKSEKWTWNTSYFKNKKHWTQRLLILLCLSRCKNPVYNIFYPL